MSFLLFSFFVLLLLILIILVGSFEQLAINIVSKKKVEFVAIMLPALFTIISFIAVYFLAYIILNILNINTLNILFSLFMKWDYEPVNVVYISITLVIATLLFILLQAFCLKLINIDYIKIWKGISSKLPKKQNEPLSLGGKTLQQGAVSVDLVKYSKYEKISFFNASVASLFSFSIIFFLTILLFFIGKYIGGRIV